MYLLMISGLPIQNLLWTETVMSQRSDLHLPIGIYLGCIITMKTFPIHIKFLMRMVT